MTVGACLLACGKPCGRSTSQTYLRSSSDRMPALMSPTAISRSARQRSRDRSAIAAHEVRSREPPADGPAEPGKGIVEARAGLSEVEHSVLHAGPGRRCSRMNDLV